MIQSLDLIKNQFQALNIPITVSRTHIAATYFGEVIKVFVNGDRYDLEYTVNGKPFEFKNQPFEADAGQAKMGLYMFFDRLAENQKKDSRYYGKMPNFAPYKIEGENVEDLTKAVKRMSKIIVESNEEIELYQDEIRTLSALLKEKTEMIDKLQADKAWYEESSLQGIEGYEILSRVYTPGTIEIEE
jgi:hypothetical protein